MSNQKRDDKELSVSVDQGVVEVRRDGEVVGHGHVGTFRVEEYKKPEFEVSVEPGASQTPIFQPVEHRAREAALFARGHVAGIGCEDLVRTAAQRDCGRPQRGIALIVRRQGEGGSRAPRRGARRSPPQGRTDQRRDVRLGIRRTQEGRDHCDVSRRKGAR